MPAENPRLARSQTPKIPTGIVHLGIGAFCRAHVFKYTRDAVRKSGGNWGIVGVSLRSPGQRDKLAPQGFAYTAVTMAHDGLQADVLEIVNDVLVAPENPSAVLDVMAAPATRIVTMTITEKGYCHVPSTGRLNKNHPDILHDIDHPDAPKSAIAFLVRALQRRHRSGVKPFTVLTCDNLPDNGSLVHTVVTEFADLVDPVLADWIRENVPFPSTMVDRIVPATTEEDIKTVADLTCVLDLSPVMCEPFSQWVIEDDFVDDERPDWGAVGAELVTDVKPFELMKLRCLNGTHSALAYLGYLAGHETINDTVQDKAFLEYVLYLWDDEIVPSLQPPEGTDLHAYTRQLLERYANPAIRHRTWQIAMDGSQKLPQRILGTIADNLAADRPIIGLSLAVAAWMRYVAGTDESGAPIDVRDPLADELRRTTDHAASPTDAVDALLAMRSVFPEALAANVRFRSAVHEAHALLVNVGARESLKIVS